MHDLVWGKVHSLALLLMSRALSFLCGRKRRAGLGRIGCRVGGRKLAAEPGELGSVGGSCTGVRYPWRGIPLGGPLTLAWGVSRQKRSVGSVGHFDELGTLRVACSHHAYTVVTQMVTCGFAHDSYSVLPLPRILIHE